MSDMTTIGVLRLFETTKEQRREFIQQAIEAVEQGDIDVKKMHLQVKAMEEVIKGIMDDQTYREMLLDEASSMGKSFEWMNADWQIKEVGVSYDYSLCNDVELQELQQHHAELGERIKERQAFLKLLPVTGLTAVDKETGEIYKIYPPIKKSTTSVTVKLK